MHAVRLRAMIEAGSIDQKELARAVIDLCLEVISGDYARQESTHEDGSERAKEALMESVEYGSGQRSSPRGLDVERHDGGALSGPPDGGDSGEDPGGDAGLEAVPV